MITLTYLTTTLTLDPDLVWADEYSWNPVEQAVDRTLTGALIVQVAARVAGRPITLLPEDAGASWMARSLLDSLRAWAAIPGAEMTLSLRGVDRDVMFRHQDTAIEARPVVHYADPGAADWYLVTLRFMEI